MNLSQENINSFLSKYINFVNELSKEYNYTDNIRHLLYLIIPAFIVKYGSSYENSILECFRKVKIYISDTKDKVVTASFNRTLNRNSSGYYTEKFVVINNYSDSSLPDLIDNIVHEFNHAINSLNNEIYYDDNTVMVRTGLSTLNYDRKTLNFIGKSDTVSLEEILNTIQTEEVINIINSFGKYSIENLEFSNMLYALKSEINGEKFESLAYSYQKYICKELLNNKTFTPTVNNLRFKGFVTDIPHLFDDVIGVSGSYKKLNKLLTEIHTLILKYNDQKLFKNRTLNKIKEKTYDVDKLIKDYDSKCIYK